MIDACTVIPGVRVRQQFMDSCWIGEPLDGASDSFAEDVRCVVVGSGAGGGMAAKILTEGGLNVALLEAGPQVHPEKDFKMFMWPYELPHRGVGVGGRAAENFGEFLAPNGAWDD